MGLLDVFKPRWRHSNPEVRADAVRAIEADQLDLLRRVLAEETQPNIRRIAYKKIDDPAVLTELAAAETDAALKKLAGEKAAEGWLAIALAGDEESSPDALAKLSATRELAEVARRGATLEIRQAAVNRLGHGGRPEDEKVLRELAVNDPQRDIALLATSQLKSEETLALVAERGKMKAIRAAAEERRAALFPRSKASPEKQAAQVNKPAQANKPAEPSEAVRRRARQLQLCRLVEALATHADLAAARRELETCQAGWLEISWTGAEADLQARWDHACHAIDKRLAEDKAAKEALERAAADKLRRQADKPHAERPTSAAASEPEAPATKGADDDARRPAAERPRKTRELSPEEKAESEAIARRIEEDCRSLERTLSDETADLKRMSEAQKTIEAKLTTDDLGRAPAAARQQLRDLRDKIVARANELREAERWRRWANIPRLEKLCERAEALAAIEDLAAVSETLKQLREEWKTAGPAPRDKSEALWQRFNGACDKAFERVREHRGQQKEVRSANLKAREELIAKLETLVGTMPQNQDQDDKIKWKELTVEVKALQAAWKEIGAVPRAKADDSWQKFRGLCDQFFERRKAQLAEEDAERAENLAKLTRLCEAVEQLAAKDPADFRAAADKVKALQAEWKEVGPAPRTESDAVWQRFRGACDRFFERRKAHFETQDAEREKNVAAKEALIAEVAALDPSDARTDDKVREAHARWREIGHVPRELSDDLWARFREACDQAVNPPMEEPAPGAVGIAGFTNRLPLEGLAEKLGVATGPADGVDKPQAASESETKSS